MNKKFCDVCGKLIYPEFWKVVMIPYSFMKSGTKEFDVCSADCLKELFEATAEVIKEKDPDFSL